MNVQWSRASQFNWVFDNMGGAPLQEAVAGNWSDAAAVVQEDGQVTIQSPLPGGGQVYLVRGVWRAETRFPWDGFWAAPLDGDLINYFQGGSFTSQGSTTRITLGTALPPGTPVQLYYIYLTGERAARYEPLNNYPCIRRASRSRDDYTYDFAVDRLLDLMVFLYLAGRTRQRDYSAVIEFLWEAYYRREESCTPPLVYDSFERQLWNRGAHLLYRGGTIDNAFQDFQIESLAGSPERVLHVRVDLPSTQDAAWFGYGLDWALEQPPFTLMDRVRLSLMGRARTRRLHNPVKTGSGSATLVLLGDYTAPEKRRWVVEMETTGQVGQATFRWSGDDGMTWQAQGLVSGDRQHPVALEDGVLVCWESGGDTDLVAGDCWRFWGGEPAEHPCRLLLSLNDSAPGNPDPWTPEHTFVHALPDRFAELTALDLPFHQFWRRDNIIDDGDRVRRMWGAWHTASQADVSEITICDREETEDLFGDTFYTQRRVSWNLSPYATALGVWVGLDPGECDSTGRQDLNFLIKPVLSGANTLTIRVKVKDARGSYFYQNAAVSVNAWQRVTVELAGLLLESGLQPLMHPLQAVDLGIPAAPPSNGAFYVTDLKFDAHVTFVGAPRLRLLEFKLEEQGLGEQEWWLDKVGLNLEAQDPYPYAPRLAVSLTPYGQNPWRGPTLVHYVQPLAPHLVNRLDLVANYLNLHRDAQDEFHSRYCGLKGPVMPVHTRNDIENIALCGEEDFTHWSWWAQYRHHGRVSGAWHFNGALTDASGHGHTLDWSSGVPSYTTGVCQPGNTAVVFNGSAHAGLASNALFEPGTGPFSITLILKGAPQETDYCGLVDKLGAVGWVIRTKTAGSADLQLKAASSAGDSYSDIPTVLDGNWHMVTWMVDPANAKIHRIKDGVLLGQDTLAVGAGLSNTADLHLGSESSFTLDYLKYERRVLPPEEYQQTWGIVRGEANGSAYPEVGCGLAQYWAFMRLAQYFFATNDDAAWEMLDNWLAWLDAHCL